MVPSQRLPPFGRRTTMGLLWTLLGVLIIVAIVLLILRNI